MTCSHAYGWGACPLALPWLLSKGAVGPTLASSALRCGGRSVFLHADNRPDPVRRQPRQVRPGDGSCTENPGTAPNGLLSYSCRLPPAAPALLPHLVS